MKTSARTPGRRRLRVRTPLCVCLTARIRSTPAATTSRTLHSFGTTSKPRRRRPGRRSVIFSGAIAAKTKPTRITSRRSESNVFSRFTNTRSLRVAALLYPRTHGCLSRARTPRRRTIAGRRGPTRPRSRGAARPHHARAEHGVDLSRGADERGASREFAHAGVRLGSAGRPLGRILQRPRQPVRGRPPRGTSASSSSAVFKSIPTATRISSE